MENRGSVWRKWDLHIHSPASIKQQYTNTEEGWEKFINALENLPEEVKVIGITDYYFIDGYEKVMDYKINQNRLENIDKIFPILEFRIDTFGTASESKLQKINLHILFYLDETSLNKQIQKVCLFCSFARNEENLDSDIDLLIRFLKPSKIDLFEYIGIRQDLEDLTGRQIDLVEEGQEIEKIKLFINKDKRLIYERKAV